MADLAWILMYIIEMEAMTKDLQDRSQLPGRKPLIGPEQRKRIAHSVSETKPFSP